MCGCPKYPFLLLWYTPNEAARANRLVHVLRRVQPTVRNLPK